MQVIRHIPPGEKLVGSSNIRNKSLLLIYGRALPEEEYKSKMMERLIPNYCKGEVLYF